MTLHENDRSMELHTQIQHALMEELSASVEKYRAVVNNLDEVAFQIDATGTLTFVNDAWLRLFGSSPDSVLGHSLNEYMGEDEDCAWLETALHSDTQGSTVSSRGCVDAQDNHHLTRNISMMDAQRRPCPSALSMCRVKDGWIGSIRDLREELKIEARLQQAAQMEAVGRVAGGVAHDFNNLLTVIGGNLELIQMSTTQDEGDDLTEIFEDVFSAVDHGAVLVGHLQSFTHDQAYEPALLNIEDVLIAFCETVVKSFRSSITVKQEITENLLVRVDERALKGALLNIALNAQDAMEHGGTLSIWSRVQWIAEKDQERFGGIPTGEYVAIETQDTGRGIPAGLLSRITEPFFTGNSSGSGSGLGLSMVKHFVEQSTGGLEITSCEGRGTTVTILLPHISETDAVCAKNEWAATVDQAAGRVLLVEDSDSVRKYAKRCLSRMGYEVVTARNGVDGLEQLERSGHFDLIFSDVVMPGGVSGHDLAAHAEELFGSGTLILLTSGYISEEQRDSHNHWNYLRKPYTASQLGRRIKELLLEQDTHT